MVNLVAIQPLVAALTLFDFESPEVRKLHPECVAKNAVGGDWSLCVTNAKPVELKLPLRDLTPYEKVVFDVVTVGSSGKVTLSSSFNNAKGGVRARSVDLLCGGYERWEVDLFEWPEAIRPHDVDTLRLWLENPSGKDEVYVDNVTLTKPGEKLPPAPPMFQTMRRRAQDASAERIVEENRVAHAKAYAAFAADCAAKGQAASSPYLLGEASPMEKVLPRGRNAPRALDVKKGLSVGLAKYEKEAVQLLVAPRKGDLRKVTVEAKGFAGLPLAAIECRVTGYVRTFLPPPYKVFEGTNTVSQAPEVGWWPDPILDYLPATDVRGEDIQSFWIRVRCPEDQKPGVYKGELVVRAEGEKPQAVPFAVRVYDFAVPKRAPYSQACTFSPGPNTQFESAENLARAKRLAADPLGPCNAWKKHELAWGDFLADYYITMDNLYHRGDATKGIPHFDVLRRLKDQGRLDWFNLGYWSEPKELTDAAKAEWREKTLGRIGACYRKAKELGIDDHAYIYGCDEAAKEKFPQIRWAIDELKRAFPGVPVFTTAYDNEFGVGTALSGIDWFTPLTPEYRPAKAAAARKEGRQVWWYICCGPGNPYANMFIESPALEGRSLMGQQAVKYRPDGFLYYQLTLWNAECPISGDSAFTDWTARSWTKLNGDGSWTCCGPDGTPLATQRLENFRDGLEDYAYAMELERRMKAKPGHPLEAKAKELLEVRDVKSLEDFTREPERIAAWRRALAETIEAYGAARAPILLSELDKCCVAPTWRQMPYETVDGIVGRAFFASRGMKPLTRLEFKLPVRGRYRIHLGLMGGRGGGYMTMVRLSSDPAPVLIDACADSKDASFWVQPVEIDWKVADLDNDRLILENLPRHASVLAWIRLEPTDERIGPPVRVHDMIATNDGYWPASNFDEVLAPIMRLKDSPVTEIHYCVGNGVFSFAAPSKVGIPCDFVEGGEYQDDWARETARTYSWLRKDHPHLVDELADFTHSLGMKFCVSFRTGCMLELMRSWQLAEGTTPTDRPDGIRCPENYCRLWDGTPVLRPSYARKEVQDFFLRFYAEQLTDKVDGLSLVWQRAMPAMLFEQAFRDRFKAHYGEELKSPDDPRVRTLRADILTEFLAKVRKLVGKRKLTLFVGPDRETNEKFGLDLRRLAEAGIADEFVPGYSKQDARHTESEEFFDYKYLREAVAGTKTTFRTMFWGEAQRYRQYVSEGAVGVANWDCGNHPWSVWQDTRLLYDKDGSLQKAWTDAHPHEKAVHPLKTLNGFDYRLYPYHVAY